MPEISVIVCTRNRAGLLKDCLDSLRKQTFLSNDYELIVVDDGSTDQTPEMMQQ